MEQTDICNNLELSPIDLYRYIISDNDLEKEVMGIAQNFDSQIDSLIKAILVLGAETMTEITLDAIENFFETNEDYISSNFDHPFNNLPLTSAIN